jgi:hypothetical protein
MQGKVWGWTAILFALASSAMSSAQVKQEQRAVVVNGKSGTAPSVQINGRTFVDMEGIARIANGSLGFQGDQLVLTVPCTSAAAPASAPEPEPVPHNGLSHEFMKAGIETLAQMREWASTLGYAIQNGYGVTETWVADYREQANSSLRLASAAASTDADRSALQLLTHEFDGVTAWSNELLEAKKRMDVGKYATSPGALRNDPNSQKLIACGRFLATMIASSEYRDDPSCH